MFSDFENFRKFSTQRCKLKTLLEKVPKYEEKQIQEMLQEIWGKRKEILVEFVDDFKRINKR